MKVRIFKNVKVAELEDEINQFIDNENIEVIKLHFQASEQDFSCLIEYKEKD